MFLRLRNPTAIDARRTRRSRLRSVSLFALNDEYRVETQWLRQDSAMSNWVWNNLIAPWPDVVRGTLEIRDLLGLTLASLGVVLTIIAIQMGRRQGRIAREQTLIAMRQAETSEKQHQIVLTQMKRQANLTMEMSERAPNEDGGRSYAVYIKNNGDKSARDFHWEVHVPAAISFKPSLKNATQDEGVVAIDYAEAGEHEDFYVTLRGHSHWPVHPNRAWELGNITTEGHAGNLILRWVIDAQDGLFPPGDHFGFLKDTFWNPQ